MVVDPATLSAPPADVRVPEQGQAVAAVVAKTPFEQANLSPTSGDCESIAAALTAVFSAEAVVLAFQSPADRQAAHAAVVIDGTLVDATGRTTYDTMYDYAVSGLRPAERFDYDDHIVTVPASDVVLAGADRAKAQTARSLLLEALEQSSVNPE